MHSWIFGLLIVGALLVAGLGATIIGQVAPDNGIIGGSCCEAGSGGGGGCSSGLSCCSGDDDDASYAETEQLAADYYVSKTGDTGNFTVSVEDFGCHREAKIIKDDKVVMELTISGGTISEI
jgi:hypothetical protein